MGNPILAGLGFSLPKRQVSNHDLVGRINTSDEFIVERTGVRTRYHVEPEQAVSALMVPAARQAIEAAGLLPEDIDLLLVNTLSPDHHDPSQACLIQPLLKPAAHPGTGYPGTVQRVAVRLADGSRADPRRAGTACPGGLRRGAVQAHGLFGPRPQPVDPARRRCRRSGGQRRRASTTACWTCAWAPTATTSTC